MSGGVPSVVVASGDRELAGWPLPARDAVDLALVDRLAWLQLAARRMGFTVRLRNPYAELVELLDLVGLRIEVVRQAEGGEPRGVEEVVVPDDPVA